MALKCQVSLNYASYTAGQNPPPMATLLVFNPGASAVVVTGVQLEFSDQSGDRIRPAVSPGPMGGSPGMTVSVPTLDDITIGPFPIAVGSAAAANSFAMVEPGDQPPNAQPSQPMQSTILIGATVYGSDGSINVAGPAGLLVSYTSAPPVGYQGGFLQFASPNNFIGTMPGWP